MVSWSGAAGALPPEAALKAVYVPGVVVPRKRLCHPPCGAKALKPKGRGGQRGAGGAELKTAGAARLGQSRLGEGEAAPLERGDGERSGGVENRWFEE